MKAGWRVKLLGDVCTFDKVQGTHSGLPYVGLEDIQSNTARFLGSFEQQPVKSSTFKFSRQHILYGRLRPYLNKVLAPDFEGHCSTEIFPLKPSPELSREYLLYWLLSDETCSRINATCTGARMPRAQMNEVLGFEFQLPPLLEQRRIVALLDKAFDGIATAKANAEKNLHNACALFESHLQSVFTGRGEGWMETTLGEIGKVSMCKRIFKEQTNTTGDIPFYKIGTFGKEADSYISNEIYRQYREKYPFPNKGDVLISAAGTIGRRVVYDGEHGYFQDSNIVWIANDQKEVLNRYLYHFYGACEWNSTSGATISRLYNDNLRRIRITFPKSLQEQECISAGLDELYEETQRLESLYQRKLAALDELKQSLLHQAFSGAL